MRTKTKQRWLALLMAFVVIIGMLPTTTFAEGQLQTQDSHAETSDLQNDNSESEGHTHSATCYCSGGEQICTLEESEGHSHNENCYDEEGNLICGLEETDGHSHGNECVCPGGELICGQEESEENTHNEENYNQGEGLLYQQNEEINLAAESQYLTVKLNWTGDEGKEALRGSSLQVLVTTNSSAGGTYITLNANSGWQTRTYLPLKDSSGNPYAYTLDIARSVYSVLHAYRIDKCELENGILNVDIAFQETTDIDIELTWDDYNDTMGLRPENAAEAAGYKLYISGSGKEYAASAVSDITDSKCTVTFKDIPTTYQDVNGQLQKIGYGQYGLKLTDGNYYELPDTVKVTRNSYGDYWLTATATLRAMEKTIKLDIRSYLDSYGTDAKSWAAAEKWGVPVPEKIIFTILSDGQPVEGVEPAVFERNADGSWTRYTAYSYTWYLPLVNDEGDTIDYGTLTVGVSTDLGDGMPKQYKQNPEKITLTSDSDESKTLSVKLPGITYLTIRPAWEDDNNKTGLRPTTLSATLLADGEPVGTTQTIKTGSSTNVTAWNNLPQLDSNGNYIHYTVRYEGIPAYYTETMSESPAYSEEKGYGSDSLGYLYQDVTFTMKSQSAKATVYWEGDGIGSESELVNRPDSTILKLYYTPDDGDTWKEFWGTSNYAVTRGNDTNTWTYEWTALPAVDEEGNPVRYKAVQLPVPAAYSSTADEPVYTKDDEGNVASSTFSFHNSYNDNWNYTIDLSWNTTNPAEKYEIDNVTTSRTELVAQYLLSISVQKPYKAGEFEIRIPYELFDSRDGSAKGTVPSRFSVGDYTNPSSAYSITYRIDDKGTADTSDDEVVFYNYKDLSASENIQVTVEYKFYPYNVVDCSTGSLTATATARYDGQAEAETQISGPITYRLDTGVEDFTVSKELYELVYSWPSEFGEKPAQFDTSKYNYVIYKVERPNGIINSNQPAIFEYTDTPGDDGKVVAVQSGYTSSKSPYAGTIYTIYTGWDKDEAGATWQETYKDYASVGYYNSYSYYVMVQYPRVAHEDPLNPGQTTYETDYHNEAEFRFVATDEHEGDKGENDKNDVIIKQAATTAHWVDYEFHYDGDLYSTSKFLYSFKPGALDLLRMGKVQSVLFDIGMTVNGYELADGYRMDLTDDAVYARATINGKSTEYIRLTEEDYEFSGTPYITIECSDIDRSNGATIDGKVSEKPFSVYGRKGNNGTWELLGQFSMTGVKGYYRPVGDLTGQGYTALKIQSPEDLQGKYYVRLQSVNVSIKPESPVFLAWLENGDDLTYIGIQNIAAYDLYKSDGKGNEEWINPYTNSSNSLSKEVGLDESDKEEFGAYRHRKNSGATMYPATWTSAIVKNVYDLAYDVSAETVSVGFNIYAYEGTTTSFDEYPAEKCENGGVFYDLLPPGFSYDASKGMNVYSYKIYGGKEQYAALENLTVIDNYKDSGRQLLVVKVKSTREDGQNWSSGYSGFYISYYAKASYDDVTSGKTIYNSVAYQRDDLKTISACRYTEDGKPWNNADIWPEDDSGVPVFYDINGDGIVTEDKNTLYGYASFTPSIIQTIQNGLTKRVKGISGIYKSEDVTGLGETYSYKLRLTTQKSGETSNVVIYDILENAANTGGHSGEDEGWKGTFASVSTRNIKLQGIAPTVWYSTTQGLSYNDPDGLLIESKPENWSLTPPDDLSKVTAIAFDLRKGLDGSNYVFAAGQSVEMEVFMTAPSSMQASEYAYNRPAYNATFRAANVQEGTTSFNISDRTAIALHDLQEFSFIKQYLKEDGSLAPLSGVTFQLYKCTNGDADHTHTGIPGQADSCWGKTPVQTVSSKTDGEVKFSELDTGAYAIYESASKDGFKRIANQYWLIDVDAKEGTISAPVAIRTGSSTYPLVEMQWNEASDEMQGYYSLLNERPVRSIDAVKTWYEDSAKLIRPAKLTFDLYRNGELYATKEVTVSTTSNSQTFKDLFTGLFVYDEYGTAYTYKVVERIPEGYTEDKNGEVTLPLTIGTSTAYFTNRRLGVLDVSKVVSGKITDEAFSFTVTLTDSQGNAIDITDADGNPVTFTGRRFTTDASSYTEETLTLTDGGKLTFQLKDGETLRIIGLPIGIKWSVSEGTAAQYNTTVSPDPASGTTSQTVNGKVTFTNTLKTGSLKVSKTIAGNAADSGKEFNFTVTLDDTSINGIYSGIEFTDGKATFSLKGGESKLIEGLPEGTGYTVTEADYSGDGYVTTKTGETGKINEKVPAVAAFTNTRDTYGKLIVTKTIAGNAPSADKEFSFTVTLDDTSISGTYGDMTFTDGVASFTLKGGESKSAENLPNGLGYTVTEADYSEDGYVTTKTGDTGTIVGNDTVTAAFTNTRDTYGKLIVTKTIAGNAPSVDKEFSFTVTFDDTSINGTYGDMVFTDGVASFTLKGGESKSADNLPNGLGYTVTEADYSEDGYVTTKTGDTGTIVGDDTVTAAFTNTRDTYGKLIVTKTIAGNAPSAEKEFSFTVKLGDTSINGTYGDMTFTEGVASFTLKGGESKSADNLPNGLRYTVTEADYAEDGYVTTKTGDTGTIAGDDTVTAAFTNTRNADGSLTVSKTIAGNDPDSNKEFTFTVTLDDTSISGTYSGIEFTAGKATFTLKGGESKVIEGLPNGTGYTVTEADYSGDGYVTIKTGETGKINEKVPVVAAFTNTRDTYGKLIVTKTIAGNAPSAEKEFSFTVKLGDTSINGTYGDMVFTDGVASFTLKGGESKSADNLPNGLGYTVTEADYSEDGYVTTKTGDTGTIVGDDTVTAAFTNTRDTYGKLIVTKTIAGNAPSADKEFSFTVTLGDTSLNGTYGDMVFTDGVASFTLKGGESKSADNLPNGLGYTVTEADYSEDGYVTTKTGDTGTIAGEDTVTAAFTNTRDTYGKLIVTKTIAGNAPSADKEFSFTVTLGDTSLNGTYGDMVFTDGVASFTLKGGENKSADNLPNGLGYTVTEADYSEDGYVTTKTGDTGTIVGNDTVTAAFTNTRDTYGKLIVTKTIAGNAPSADKEFSFTVTLGDTSINGTYGDMVFTDGVASFTLKGGESKSADNLPNGLGYTVTEADYSEDGYVTTKTGDTGTIVGDDVVTAAFINTRDVTTPPTPTNPSNPTKSTDKALKTGDKSNMYMWLALMICSFAVFASCIYGVKRRSAGSHSRKENE